MNDIILARRVHRIQPSATITVSNRARELRAAGRNVIGLGAGEPDFDTPQPVKAAAIHAIERGDTKYTAPDGTPELKQAIIAKFQRENGLDYRPDQVLVSAGAKHSLFNLLQALIDNGDEVIIPAPYWVSYPDMVALADGVPIIVPTGIEQAFKLTPARLAACITPQTKLLLLNSPGNPTGAVYTRAELIALGEVLAAHPAVWIASDDIYEHILWADEPFANIVNACPALYDRTVVVNGVSKAYAMTGWRIGYAAGPTPLIGAMKKIQSQSTSNPASISQAAATAALAGSQDAVTTMVAAFRERSKFVTDRLNRITGVHCLPCQGAFYAFADFADTIERLPDIDDDTALAAYILDRAEVALVPGSAFGAPGFLRLSYATDLATLDRALERLERLFVD